MIWSNLFRRNQPDSVIWESFSTPEEQGLSTYAKKGVDSKTPSDTSQQNHQTSPDDTNFFALYSSGVLKDSQSSSGVLKLKKTPPETNLEGVNLGSFRLGKSALPRKNRRFTFLKMILISAVSFADCRYYKII